MFVLFPFTQHMPYSPCSLLVHNTIPWTQQGFDQCSLNKILTKSTLKNVTKSYQEVLPLPPKRELFTGHCLIHVCIFSIMCVPGKSLELE